MKYSVLCPLIGLTFLVLYAQEASAYLDPSSGSILIQIVLGGIAGFFVLLKIYWRRIRRFLGLYKVEGPLEAQEQDANNE